MALRDKSQIILELLLVGGPEHGKHKWTKDQLMDMIDAKLFILHEKFVKETSTEEIKAIWGEFGVAFAEHPLYFSSQTPMIDEKDAHEKYIKGHIRRRKKKNAVGT